MRGEQEEQMTGMEAWSLVAPILAAHSVKSDRRRAEQLDALDEAYVLVFGALNEHDKRKERDG